MNKRFSIILVLDESEIKRLEYDEVGKYLFANPDILIVSRTYDTKDRFLKNLTKRGLLNHRTVLLKSPYDDVSFQELTEAHLAFALEKSTYFSLFCNHLGAKEVIVEQIENSSKSGRVVYNVEADTVEVKGKIEGEDEQIDIFKSKLSLHDVFAGGEPQISKAEALLEKYKLLGDPSMLSLLEIQRSKTSPISSRKLSLDLSRESKHLFSIAGNVKIPVLLSEFQGSLKKITQQSTDFVLTITVKF